MSRSTGSDKKTVSKSGVSQEGLALERRGADKNKRAVAKSEVFKWGWIIVDG